MVHPVAVLHLFPLDTALFAALFGNTMGIFATGFAGVIGVWSVGMAGRAMHRPWVGSSLMALLTLNGVKCGLVATYVRNHRTVALFCHHRWNGGATPPHQLPAIIALSAYWSALRRLEHLMLAARL
jgi:hypothetical protein